MPEKRREKYGLIPASPSYQKGGSKYQEGTVGGKPYEGTRYLKAKQKPIKIIDTMDEAVDPDYEYKLAKPYQANRPKKK